MSEIGTTLVGMGAGISAARIVGRPFQPGQSGNPSGRPKLGRAVSKALADLQDTPGTSYEDAIENFKAARGAALCVADLKAIAAFRREMSEESVGVAQLNATMDRLEGPVVKAVDVKHSASLTINVVPLAAMLEGFVSPQHAAELAGVVDAEVVEDEK